MINTYKLVAVLVHGSAPGGGCLRALTSVLNTHMHTDMPVTAQTRFMMHMQAEYTHVFSARKKTTATQPRQDENLNIIRAECASASETLSYNCCVTAPASPDGDLAWLAALAQARFQRLYARLLVSC